MGHADADTIRFFIEPNFTESVTPMNIAVFEDQVLNAIERPDKAVCCELTRMLGDMGKPVPADISEKLEVLWEGWSGALNDVQAAFCVFAASRGAADTPQFRKVFATAVKRSLPPYLGSTPVMRALGARDDKRPPREVAERLQRLLNLKVGAVLFMPSTRRWAVAGTVDAIAGSLPVSAFAGSGGAARLPLEVILPEVVLLNPGTELSRLVEPLARPLPSEMFRSAIARRAILPIDSEMMKLMAQNGCARGLDGAAFDTWWNGVSTAAPAVEGGTRRSCDGRSIKEMALLLSGEAKSGAKTFSADEAEAFEAFFTRLKPDTARREEKTLAEIVGTVFSRLPDGLAGKVFSPLVGKASFWPADPSASPLSGLTVWGNVAAKVMEPLTLASFKVLSPEVLSALVMKLPLKALNCFVPNLDGGVLLDTVYKYRNCGADILMWVWKNRKKLPDRELLDLVNIENVTRTLAAEEPPKEWGAARRELRALLMDDEAFQTRMLEAAAGNTEMVCTILQSSLFLSSGERQSLIVKLARLSPSLRTRLESGAGSRIVNSDKKNGDAPEVPQESGFYTSVKSQKALMNELEDIINVQIPENREALKTARAHGDFRENSEFDAAKERRNHLSRRRGELERNLAQIQPVLMRQVKVTDEAVIGSEIELKYDDGTVETYELLGAWDSDPQRRFLSYRARLGAAVLHRRVGESFAAPGGRNCTLTAVRELSEELKAELDA